MGFVLRYKDGTCYVIGFIVEIVGWGGVGWGGWGGVIAKYVQVCTEHIRKRRGRTGNMSRHGKGVETHEWNMLGHGICKMASLTQSFGHMSEVPIGDGR